MKVTGRRSSKYRRILVEELRTRDGDDCWLCGERISYFHMMPGQKRSPRLGTLDHVIPLIKGGTNEIENLRLAHLSCNKKKGDRYVDSKTYLLSQLSQGRSSL